MLERNEILLFLPVYIYIYICIMFQIVVPCCPMYEGLGAHYT